MHQSIYSTKIRIIFPVYKGLIVLNIMILFYGNSFCITFSFSGYISFSTCTQNNDGLLCHQCVVWFNSFWRVQPFIMYCLSQKKKCYIQRLIQKLNYWGVLYDNTLIMTPSHTTTYYDFNYNSLQTITTMCNTMKLFHTYHIVKNS